VTDPWHELRLVAAEASLFSLIEAVDRLERQVSMICPSPQDPVLVVGAGRTGTSEVARVLEVELGVDMGGEGLRADHVPNGCYEDRRLTSIDMMYARGVLDRSSWRRWIRAETDDRRGAWGYKSPSMPLKEWIEEFPNARVVWCVRDMEPTILSWIKTTGCQRYEAQRAIEARLEKIGGAITLHVPARWRTINMTGHVEPDQIRQALAGLVPDLAG